MVGGWRYPGYYRFNNLADMVVTGTKEAFMALISRPGFAKASGIDKTMVSLWKSGKRVPSLDKMEEVLKADGAIVKQEKIWEVNSIP